MVEVPQSLRNVPRKAVYAWGMEIIDDAVEML
jgi:hypothetical protein